MLSRFHNHAFMTTILRSCFRAFISDSIDAADGWTLFWVQAKTRFNLHLNLSIVRMHPKLQLTVLVIIVELAPSVVGRVLFVLQFLSRWMVCAGTGSAGDGA
jgi:hypothetical protein